MKREDFEIWAIDYLRGDLSKEQEIEFNDFLKKNESFKVEFDELLTSWDMLNMVSIPEPSENMDAKFYEQLYLQENSATATSSEKNWFQEIFTWFRPQYAFGLILLILGLVGGYFLRPDTQQSTVQTAVVEDGSEVREKLVLTLLEQPSANKRLQGVHEVTKMDKTTEAVTKALFTTLNRDSNVNVRLAAVESLSKYVENPEVRMGLIQSISNQDSPIVQIALADLMVALQEKESIKSMEELLDKPDIDTTVSKKLKESINQII
ncbi:HEAT repeat domain-containing protein [Croceivirga thetidis]|uniref:HEAT repeat domain-containing protein n=1 Tax=Croceivirga thetidis TaxID=2721623 RepID=A0ABX1GLC9_9FLAO|nr:HEAT repeat domain-containing protein [Croceivirga thetidis]NKI30673.1 HEAT repeat domain-containing protein [Croceivirga thetidis]